MEDRLRELLPCPFCGGEAHIYTRMDEDIWTHNIVEYGRVECSQCDCETEDWPTYDRKPEKRWNTRATDPLMEEMVEVLRRVINICYSAAPDDLNDAIDEILQKYREATCQQEKK